MKSEKKLPSSWLLLLFALIAAGTFVYAILQYPNLPASFSSPYAADTMLDKTPWNGLYMMPVVGAVVAAVCALFFEIFKNLQPSRPPVEGTPMPWPDAQRLFCRILLAVGFFVQALCLDAVLMLPATGTLRTVLQILAYALALGLALTIALLLLEAKKRLDAEEALKQEALREARRLREEAAKVSSEK